MTEKSLKEIADNLMKIKGNVKGEVIRTNFAYINDKKGEEGVRMAEEKLAELGYPLKFKEIKPLEWYPEALSALLVIVSKNIFNWTEADIFDMGNSAPKYSFIVVKILLKYFVSIKRVFEEAPRYWKRHFDYGELETVELNEKEKYAVVRAKGHQFHPLVCIYEAGYFLRILQFAIKSKKTSIKETKCTFKGDPYHEYVLRWE